MPEAETPLDDEECDMLKRICQKYGLTDMEQVTEWLLKSGIRKQARTITGRGRALYPIDRKPS